jgi:hypothetical protein
MFGGSPKRSPQFEYPKFKGDVETNQDYFRKSPANVTQSNGSTPVLFDSVVWPPTTKAFSKPSSPTTQHSFFFEEEESNVKANNTEDLALECMGPGSVISSSFRAQEARLSSHHTSCSTFSVGSISSENRGTYLQQASSIRSLANQSFLKERPSSSKTNGELPSSGEFSYENLDASNLTVDPSVGGIDPLKKFTSNDDEEFFFDDLISDISYDDHRNRDRGLIVEKKQQDAGHGDFDEEIEGIFEIEL